MRNRGFTLVELAISIALMGVVAVAVGSVFVNGLRTYARQVELAHLRANLRQAMATLSRELRGLDAGDPLGGDIAEIASSAITYRAYRNAYFLCTPPDVSTATLTVWQDPRVELRRIDPERDSILLFAENDEATPDDNRWIAGGLRSISDGGMCPGGIPGIRLGVRGVPASELEGVGRGAIVRGYQMTKILLYRDAGGLSWVGLREWRPGSGWTITQPIFGPVTNNGLRFDYFNSGGGRAGSPADVARVVAKVSGADHRLDGPTAISENLVADSLEVHVGLRNNPRGN